MKPVLQPDLRYPRTWFLCGLVIAVAIAFASLTPAQNLPQLKVSDKLEHALAYLLLAFWFASVIVRRDYFGLMVALLAFGGLIELVQGWMGLGRTADLLDLLADAAGIVMGVLLAITPLGHWAHWVENRLSGRAM